MCTQQFGRVSIKFAAFSAKTETFSLHCKLQTSTFACLFPEAMLGNGYYQQIIPEL